MYSSLEHAGQFRETHTHTHKVQKQMIQINAIHGNSPPVRAQKQMLALIFVALDVVPIRLWDLQRAAQITNIIYLKAL